MLIDVHLHSEISFDSNEKPENYVNAAIRSGVNVIGFSEHYDYDAVIDGADIAVADLNRYFSTLADLKRVNSNVEILFGIEFGYRDFAVSKYRELIDKFNFDYVINSVHTLAGRGDCFHDKFFEGSTLRQSYFDYLSAVLESVKADFDYQIVGHIGYVSRYRRGGKLCYKDFSDIIDEILKEIIVRGKCLELNTSVGISENKFLPDVDIISRYLQLGGEKLSFGSDAHKVGDYQRRSGVMKDFLKSVGVSRLYYYKNRQPVAYKI